MSPEQIARFEEMYVWWQQRREQFVPFPLDDASRNIIGLKDVGPGTTALTQNLVIGAGGGTFPVPRAYIGSEFIVIGGVQREIPYIS